MLAFLTKKKKKKKKKKRCRILVTNAQSNILKERTVKNCPNIIVTPLLIIAFSLKMKFKEWLWGISCTDSWHYNRNFNIRFRLLTNYLRTFVGRTCHWASTLSFPAKVSRQNPLTLVTVFTPVWLATLSVLTNLA